MRGQLEEEDRRVGRGREPGDDVGRQQGPQLGGGRGPAQPAGGVVDVVELAAVDRRDEPCRRELDGVEPSAAGCGDRRAEVLELGRDGGDLVPGPVALVGCDERQQRGAGDQLERCVEHERVGRVLAGDGEDLADVGDEAGVGGVGRWW